LDYRKYQILNAIKQSEQYMVQRVLVTAGAFGIGREIVRAFNANGAKVFVCDIDAKALDALTKELPGVKTSVCDGHSLPTHSTPAPTNDHFAPKATVQGMSPN
jgi:NAD(P)-dependent dehydrogenase (short-subunit alcohol dehydrogenase family)